MGREELLASMPLAAPETAALSESDDRAAEFARLEEEIPPLQRDPLAVAPLLRRLGDLQLARGERDRAIVTFRRAVTAWRATSDRQALAQAVFGLADLQRSGGAHGEAHKNFVDAERVFSQLGDVIGSSTCWLLIGECREATNRPGGALDAYRRAASGFQAGNGDLGHAHALFRQAAMLVDQDRPAAQRLYDEARDLYERFDGEWDPHPGIRIADPVLPDSLSDLRAIEPWILGKICKRDRIALDTRPMPVAVVEEDAEIEEGAGDDAAAGAALQRSMILGGALLLGVAAVFAVVAFVGSGRVDVVSSPSIASAVVDGSRSPSLALQLREAGDLAAARNAYDEARMAYVEALEVYRALGDRGGEASVLVALAQNEQFAGRPDAARVYYENAVSVFAQAGQTVEQAQALIALVDLEERAGDPQRVASCHARALALLREQNNRVGEVELLTRVVEFNRDRGNVVAARPVAARMVEIYEQMDDKPGLARALEGAAALAAASGDLPAAKADLVRANFVYQNIDDTEGVARSWLLLGELALAAGAPAEARGAFQNAVGVYDGSGAVAAAVDARIKVATADVALGQFESAVALYITSLEDCVRGQRKDCQANVYRRMGELDERRGRADAARLSYDKAAALLAEIGTADRVEVLLQIAALESRLGNQDASLVHTSGAMEFAASLREPRLQGAALLKSGRTAESLGQFDEARRAYDAALTSYEVSGDPAGQSEASAALEALEARRDPARSTSTPGQIS